MGWKRPQRSSTPDTVWSLSQTGNPFQGKLIEEVLLGIETCHPGVAYQAAVRGEEPSTKPSSSTGTTDAFNRSLRAAISSASSSSIPASSFRANFSARSNSSSLRASRHRADEHHFRAASGDWAPSAWAWSRELKALTWEYLSVVPRPTTAHRKRSKQLAIAGVPRR